MEEETTCSRTCISILSIALASVVQILCSSYQSLSFTLFVCLFVGCLTSQQQASVSQGRICLDNFTCCHTEIEVADQTFYLTQSQYTDTGPTSPSADPISPGAWQGNHWSANFEVTGMTRPRKNPGANGIRTRDLIFRSRGGHLTTRPTRRSKLYLMCCLYIASENKTEKRQGAFEGLLMWQRKCMNDYHRKTVLLSRVHISSPSPLPNLLSISILLFSRCSFFELPPPALAMLSLAHSIEITSEGRGGRWREIYNELWSVHRLREVTHSS